MSFHLFRRSATYDGLFPLVEQSNANAAEPILELTTKGVVDHLPMPNRKTLQSDGGGFHHVAIRAHDWDRSHVRE